MERKEVYEAIDSERDFQIEKTEDASATHMIEDFHMGDTLAAIQVNLDKARFAWYNGSVPHSDATMYLRKVAALCVQMGEKHGMSSREKVSV